MSECLTKSADRPERAHYGLAVYCARRFFGRGVPREELIGEAEAALLWAAARFDAHRGVRFSTYAVPMIAGEIKRFLRDDGVVKVSRTVKERSTAIRLAKERLSVQLGREPTLSELSTATGLEPEEIAAAETATLTVASIHSESGEEGFTLEAVLGEGGMEDEVVERLALRSAIDALPERERQVILLRFYKNLTQDRAAKVLGVSQVQVSRIERRAVEHLRQALGEE